MRLLNLTQRVGIKAQGVFPSLIPAADILQRGAQLVRWGKRERIIVDQAVTGFSPEEVEVLLARDVGRLSCRLHIKQYAAQTLSVFALCAGVGFSFVPLARWLRFSPITDVATAPVLVGLFVLFGIPVRLAYQRMVRQLEREADHYALQLTQAPEAFISVFMRRATPQPEADAPSWLALLRSSEPPLSERIAAARALNEELIIRSRRGVV
jgi:STE24 endopeptidase